MRLSTKWEQRISLQIVLINTLQADKTRLYATMWSEPPAIAAYRLDRATTSSSAPVPVLLSTAATRARSGYCCASSNTVYTAGGPTGEAFRIDPQTGAFAGGEPLQLLEFVDQNGQQDDGGTMDFGGLRHGAHSADLSPDGKLLYVADMSVAAHNSFKHPLLSPMGQG